MILTPEGVRILARAYRIRNNNDDVSMTGGGQTAYYEVTSICRLPSFYSVRQIAPAAA